MLQQLKSLFKKDAQDFPSFDGSNWKPQPYTVIKNPEIESTLAEKGYYVLRNSGDVNISEFQRVYASAHHQSPVNGGMFYTAYSQDRNYRRKINVELGTALKALNDSLFENYYVTNNSFIVKFPGTRSEFYLHQDSTGLDEWRYSPLSLWIPLQNTNITDGCIWLIPKSHRWFSPYRGISFRSMFDDHIELLKPYLIPIEMTEGDVLLFDDRIVHLSGSNIGKTCRVAVRSGIFPRGAELISVYRDEQANGPVEIYAQEEDYLTENLNFYIDCTVRPRTGRKIGESKSVKLKMTADELRDLLGKEATISAVQYEASLTQVACDIIQEPV
ncbi:MAG: hypothetical protein GC178_03385 [Flavobacteriales bacterium]|nr:hypothetical protein [Flavobacteriales bacterium]